MRKMDLESSLFQRLKEKNNLTKPTLPLQTSPDKSGRTDFCHSRTTSPEHDVVLIPPTPSPVFAKFAGTKKRIKSLANTGIDGDGLEYVHPSEESNSNRNEKHIGNCKDKCNKKNMNFKSSPCEAKQRKHDLENLQNTRVNELVGNTVSLSKNLPKSVGDVSRTCVSDFRHNDVDLKISSTASALQRLKALRRKRFILQNGSFSRSCESSPDSNTSKPRCIVGKTAHRSGFDLNAVVQGGGWPSESDSDSSDSILLSNIIRPASQSSSRQTVSPIHASINPQPDSASSSNDSSSMIFSKNRRASLNSNDINNPMCPVLAESPFSKKLFFSPSKINVMNDCIVGCPVSPKTLSKAESKSSVNDDTSVISSISKRSLYFSPPANIRSESQLSKHNNREIVIDYLKRKYQASSPRRGLPEDIINLSENLGNNRPGHIVSGKSHKRIRPNKLPGSSSNGSNTGNVDKKNLQCAADKHELYDSSDCEILDTVTYPECGRVTTQDRTFHSMVLGLGKPSRNKGVPKIAPVMGVGWTKATTVLSNQSKLTDRTALPQKTSHSSSTAQKAHMSVVNDIKARNEMPVKLRTPEACHNSRHLTGHVTPDTHGSSFMQTTPNTQDNRVIKMVKQLEDDEDYAKKLQEEMDLEFALSLQHQAATPNHMDTDVEVSLPVQEQPGRFLATSRNTRSRTRATRQGLAISDSDDTDENYDYFGQPTRNLRDPVAEVEQLLFQLSERTHRAGRRGRRRGRGMNIVLSSPTGLNGGDNYEVLWNVADMLGDVKQKGLSKSQCNRLPIRTFKKTDNPSEDQKTECLICMCDYEDGDSLKILPCFHEFHSSCIDKWIKGNATCPVCRVDVLLQ